MTKKLYKTISSKIVHSNPYFQIKNDAVKEPDGSNGEYFVVTKNPGVFIVALNEANEVVLIKQARYFTGTESYELPAGGTDGEDPLIAAKRELQEETGLVAKEWVHLAKVYGANGISDQTHDIFMASNLEQTNSHEKEVEGITDVITASFKEISQMIKDGEMTDLQSIGAFFIGEGHLRD